VAGLYDPPPAGVKGKLRDQRIREYIDSHLEAHLSLQELADFLGMNIAPVRLRRPEPLRDDVSPAHQGHAVALSPRLR